MSQVNIEIERIKQKFSIANWISGDKQIVRKSRKAARKAKKSRTKVQSQQVKIGMSASRGERDTLLADLKSLSGWSNEEFEQYHNEILNLLVVITNEFKRIKVAIEIEKDETEKKKFIEMIRNMSNQANIWFKLCERYQGFTLNTADYASLNSEVDHIFDPMNMQSSVRRLQKTEGKINRELRRSDSNKVTGQHMRSLDNLMKQLNQVLNLDSKVIEDTVKILQLEINGVEAYFDKLIEKLNMPPHPMPIKDLQIAIKYKEETIAAAKVAVEKIVQDINGLLRILHGIKT